jgi:hypothetical protein
MSITIDNISPYFSKNEHGSIAGCLYYTINDGFELNIEGMLFNRYEYNDIDECWDIISDYDDVVYTVGDIHEEVEDASLSQVIHSIILTSDK